MARTTKKQIDSKKQIPIPVLVGGLTAIIVLGMLIFSIFPNFSRNMHGKKVCNEITAKLNEGQSKYYLIKDTIPLDISFNIGQTEAFDSEYTYQERNKYDKHSINKHICKIWLKTKNLSNRPYISIKGNFYLTDKYSAKLNSTNNYINETIKPNEITSLTFEYYTDFNEANGVHFVSNELFIPILEEEYCLEQTKLAKEAREIYNYEYNDFLQCNCSPSFYLAKNPKCDIFKNEKIKENCTLLSIIVPNCNKWLKEKYPNLINENSNKKTTKEKEDKSTKKQDKIKNKVDCKSYYDCTTDYQRKKYCRCLDYEMAKGNKNIILAPQPEECKAFCKINSRTKQSHYGFHSLNYSSF